MCSYTQATDLNTEEDEIKPLQPHYLLSPETHLIPTFSFLEETTRLVSGDLGVLQRDATLSSAGANCCRDAAAEV